ncbi:MAG: ABC transporter substrate-binding protein [Desulfomonile tiedjei]|nr:ABC transporter substrate-binding protein [Desulfomonile tiedjei]
MLLPSPAPASAFEIVDDTGRTIRLDKPATRIIALYGAYNEILASMGMESRIVGRTKADVSPPSIVSRPSIGTHMRPNVEMVMGLKPDLIIQGAGRKEAMMPVNQLSKEGLTVAVFNPTSFAEIFSVIERIGTLTGEPVEADRLVSSLKGTLDRVKKRLAAASTRPKLFFEVRYPDILSAGTNSIVNDVIEHAGGSNCVSVKKKLVRMSIETVVACNPDFYVVQEGPMNRNPVPPGERPHFSALQAVRDGRVLTVDEQVFSRPGPRSVEAVEQLATFLHPQLISEDKP